MTERMNVLNCPSLISPYNTRCRGISAAPSPALCLHTLCKLGACKSCPNQNPTHRGCFPPIDSTCSSSNSSPTHTVLPTKFQPPPKQLQMMSGHPAPPALPNSPRRWMICASALGSGSFGRVSLALDLESCTHFAIKTASADSPQQLAALQNELSILQQLSSPHIVRCLGAAFAGVSHEAHLFLEYVPGGSLADLIQHIAQFSLPVDSKLSLLNEHNVRVISRGILQGLLYLHNHAGMAHCDIKAQNILLDSTTGGIKIADFGAAKRISSSGIAVPDNTFSGTPLWMAPEVLQGIEQGPPSDIWSLGCTIVEMIQGTPPWYPSSQSTSQDLGALLLKIACSTGEVPLPETVSPEAKDFLHKCLHRDPRKRWTAIQLLQHPFLQLCHEIDDKHHFISSPRSVLYPDAGFSSDKESLLLATVTPPTLSPSSGLADSTFLDQTSHSNSSWLTVRRLGGCALQRASAQWQDKLDRHPLMVVRTACEVNFQCAAFLGRNRRQCSHGLISHRT